MEQEEEERKTQVAGLEMKTQILAKGFFDDFHVEMSIQTVPKIRKKNTSKTKQRKVNPLLSTLGFSASVC